MMLFSILLAVVILVNLWTIVNSWFLPSLSFRSEEEEPPKVSLLIPLRNEERNVEGLIQSLKKATYPNLEILLLDDHSEDRTFEKLEEEIHSDQRFTILRGKQLPEGWNGKVHACHQLSQAAQGDYYLFLDADARIAPDVIERTIATLKRKGASMISGFPNYPNDHFLGHMLVPLQHMIIHLHLPLLIANWTKKPMFTAACGIFIMIEKQAYVAIGGHESVKNSLVEDVHIAREVKKHGYKMVLANITSSVLSYMYHAPQETWEGFKKNTYTGLGRSKTLVFGLTAFYAFTFLLPFIYVFVAIFEQNWMYLLPYLLTVTFKLYIDARTGHPLWLSFLIPISISLLIGIMFASMNVHAKGKGYQWKGRSYE
ncbi:glycosyltransferase [Halobacillus fulvus]|nr:glycosyltransferase [Halobacillus fulvus]